MELIKIYSDSDFENAAVPAGQLLVFNSIEDGKVVTRYKDSSGNFGTLSGSGGSADVTLGQVDAEGRFQSLTFSGTEAANSGDPETVENFYGWQGVLPAPNGGIKVYNIGDAEYYKCASVAKAGTYVLSPQNPVNESGNGYVISASSTYSSSYPSIKAFNFPVKQDAGWFCNPSDGSPWVQIQFNTAVVVNDYSFSLCWDSDYQTLSEWVFEASNDGIEWFELDKQSSITLSPENHTYTCSINNSTAFTVYRLRLNKVPYSYIGVMCFRLRNVITHVDKTWSGYKLMFKDGIHVLETTLTENLSYLTTPPEVGGVYTETAELGISEVMGYSSEPAIPTNFTSNTSIEGYVIDQSHGSGSYPQAWCVFNQKYTTGDYAWYTGSIGMYDYEEQTAWFSIEVPEAFVPVEIFIMNEVQSPENFKDAVFQGSNNGTDWDDLLEITDSPNTTGLQQNFIVSANKAYKIFRMLFTASHASGVSVQAFQIFKKSSTPARVSVQYL